MTYLEFVARIAATPVARGHYGQRLFGAAIGLMANIVAEGLSQAVRLLWVRRDESPADAVLLVGAESRLPIYPGESQDAYKARVGDRWTTYGFCGSESVINQQIAAAGLDGTVLLQPGHPGPNLEPFYWSQFWILTTVTNAEAHATIRVIAQKWKPVDWIFRGFVFDFPDTGGDSTFAEPTFAQNSWAT